MSESGGSNSSAFLEGTAESPWAAPGDGERTYVVRHVLGDTCCDFPWQNIENWPTLSLRAFRDDEVPPSPHRIIGALWIAGKENGKRAKLVGIWGCSVDDSHVEFFGCLDGCKPEGAEEDLNAVTEALCEDICPELIDVFDDGSGGEREFIPVERSVMDEAGSLLDAALGMKTVSDKSRERVTSSCDHGIISGNRRRRVCPVCICPTSVSAAFESPPLYHLLCALIPCLICCNCCEDADLGEWCCFVDDGDEVRLRSSGRRTIL